MRNIEIVKNGHTYHIEIDGTKAPIRFSMELISEIKYGYCTDLVNEVKGLVLHELNISHQLTVDEIEQVNKVYDEWIERIVNG